MPRSDPRTAFFGQHTNCCQHLDGVGASCAASTMADPFSQLFVLEDQEGKIIAGSWVWENVADGYKTACFDNVEALGLTENQSAAAKNIYKQAGAKIAADGYRKITIGTGLSDLDVSEWPATEALRLPEKYSGYSDANEQVLVAENPNAPKVSELERGIWVRGALQTDLDAAQPIAQLCYPDGLQDVSMPDSSENTRGMVLMDKEKGVIGYAVWDTAEQNITDLAVHPDERKHTMTLLNAMISHIREVGGEWSLNARNSSTYNLIKAFEERGRIKIHNEEQAFVHDGEEYHYVRFSAVTRDRQNAPRGVDNMDISLMPVVERGNIPTTVVARA